MAVPKKDIATTTWLRNFLFHCISNVYLVFRHHFAMLYINLIIQNSVISNSLEIRIRWTAL